jgi:dTDP-4-amino-4,6-dideoxygalactose transaminase
MRQAFLPFSPPLIGEEEINEVIDTLRTGWITTGPKVKRFEEEFAAFVGAQAALALNSGTGALHVALATLGIGPGDAVITTPMTFCSSVHVIEQVGARPILVDIEPGTLNIDSNKIEDMLKLATRNSKLEIKALLPVHLYGHPCDMEAIMDIAKKYNLKVIEDAAHALPAKFNGKMIGTIGDLTAFSFYSTKNITTGEGGMLTGKSELIEEARLWSLHGMDRDAWKRYSSEGSWYYEVIRPGFKYNMPDIAAAIGIQQLRKLNQFQTRRKEIVSRYNEVFSHFEELQIPVKRAGVEHAWHLYVIRLNLSCLKINRNQFIEELKVRNIGTSVHFIPVHLHPYYRDKYGYKPEDFPIAYREYQHIVSLPLYPKMTDQDVEDVIEAVTEVVQHFRNEQ